MLIKPVNTANARTSRRTGAAAVEMTVVMLYVMVPLMVGTWEMGRVVQVQQIVGNAAREGARLAAQAVTINATGNPTQIMNSIAPASNTNKLPNVKAAVMQYLVGAGLTQLTWNDVDVTFAFIDGDTSLTDPYLGIKGQRFRVTVTISDLNPDGTTKTIPTLQKKVLWTSLGLVKPNTISFSVDWRMLVDDPFSVTTNVPGW